MQRSRSKRPTPTDNDILTVKDFTGRLKTVIESNLAPCWIRGEVSNLRRQSSGHVYFTLKDKESQLACVLFRGNASQQTVSIEESKQYIVFGEVSVYEPRGSYQLIVRWVVQDGVGRLQQAFEELRQKLLTEGLFDVERKRPLPSLPHTVGYVTSPTGAAVRDFVSILKRRNWRGRLIILPVRVQGKEAAKEMTAMLQYAQKLGIFDMLVIGRGGGSLEDLWPFNEEIFVRAVASCKVPVISGVGHEVDFTLSDFAADKRAETPSGAAELISSGFLEIQERYAQLEDQLIDITSIYFERSWNRINLAESGLKAASPKARLEHAFLRTDDLSSRMLRALRERIADANVQMHSLSLRLGAASPEAGIEYASLRLESLARRYLKLSEQSIRPKQERMQILAHRLQTSSIKDTLHRGYAILRRPDNEVLDRAAKAQNLEPLTAVFADGELKIQVTEGTKPTKRKATRKRNKLEDERQSDLGL